MNYWQDSCKFVGGHTKPKLDQCTPVASEGCDGFRKSDCQPKDEPFSENIADDAAKCQVDIDIKVIENSNAQSGFPAVL